MRAEAVLRAETPGCLHGVFLDSAGSSLPPRPVLDAVVGHLRREAEVGGYRAADERSADLANLPVALARLLGCDPPDVTLCDSATRAWTQVAWTVPLAPGDRILVTGTEYGVNLANLEARAGAVGAAVERVPSDPSGGLDLDALENLLDERVRLLSLVHVPSSFGQLCPVQAATELAHTYGCFVLLDACQSVGQRRVDVSELGVDALGGTGRKWLRAPRGTGFGYVRPGLADTLGPAPFDFTSARPPGPGAVVQDATARRFQLAEHDVAARLGLKAAVDYLLELGPDDVQAAVAAKAARLRAGLASVPGVTVHDRGTDPGGIVAFSLDDVASTAVHAQLADAGVTVGVSRRRHTPYGLDALGRTEVVRASPHYFVSDDQIDTAVRTVAGL